MHDSKPKSLLSDFAALTKPGITSMSVFMAAAGMALAPKSAGLAKGFASLAGIALIVASANALNMVIERDTDALMEHARNRPIPAGKMKASVATVFGILLGIAGLALLLVMAGTLAASLGALALGLYVFVYTPLKRVTPLALLIGALPGAFPPLIGWASATGSIGAPAVALFFVMVAWQVPHFLAIALYRKEEYARAGIRTTSVVHGDFVAKLQALAYSAILVPISLLFVPLGVAGMTFFAAVLAICLSFVAVGLIGLLPSAGDRWARGYYRTSLILPPILAILLMFDQTIP